MTTGVAIYPTAAEALEAEIEHALSMSAGYRELIRTSTDPPDRLMAYREQEDRWLAIAKRAELRYRRLQDASLQTR